MDNDKQITKSGDSKKVFLRTEYQPPARDLYVLEEEFAKTRRNKNYLVWIITIMVILAVVLVTAVFSQRIARESENIPVDINEFSDVNLQDVLDQAKSLEKQMRLKQQELAALLNAKELARDEAIQSFNKKVEILGVEVTSETERQKQTKVLELERDERLQAIDAEFDPQIRQKEREIELLQEQLNQYDGRRLAEARAQEEILNAQQKKFEIELQQTIENYEKQLTHYREAEERKNSTLNALDSELMGALDEKSRDAITALYMKYNPVIEDERLNAILSSADRAPDVRIPAYDSVLQEERIITPAEYRTLVSDMQDVVVLLETLKGLPYDNTVPEVIRSAEALSFSLVKAYNQYLTNAVMNILVKKQNIQDKEEVIVEKVTAISELDGRLEQVSYALQSEKNNREADRAAFKQQLETELRELKNNFKGQMEDVVTDYEVKQARLEYYTGAFLFALDDLSRSAREHGYVIDPRQSDHLILYMNKGIAVAEGETAFVFRSEEEYIGKIRFSTKNDIVTAEVLELVSKDKPIKPFDKILIDKRAGDSQ